MKSTMKVFLVLALFCGSAMAEGDMGNGGLWAGGTTTTRTTEDGDMGNGGKTCPQGQTTCLVDSSADYKLAVYSFLSRLFF